MWRVPPAGPIRPARASWASSIVLRATLAPLLSAGLSQVCPYVVSHCLDGFGNFGQLLRSQTRWGQIRPAPRGQIKPANSAVHRSRRLLTMADERLSPDGRTKLMGLLDTGDPNGDVRTAWNHRDVANRRQGPNPPRGAVLRRFRVVGFDRSRTARAPPPAGSVGKAARGSPCGHNRT